MEVRRPRRAPSPAGVVGYSSISPSSSSNSKHNLTLAATLPVSYHWKMVSTLDTQTRHTRTPTAHRSGKEPTCGKSPGKQSFFSSLCYNFPPFIYLRNVFFLSIVLFISISLAFSVYHTIESQICAPQRKTQHNLRQLLKGIKSGGGGDSCWFLSPPSPNGLA